MSIATDCSLKLRVTLAARSCYAPEAAPRRMYVRFGCFAERVDEFDSGAFRLSHAEAAAMDPQCRVLLEQTAVRGVRGRVSSTTTLLPCAHGVFGYCLKQTIKAATAGSTATGLATKVKRHWVPLGAQMYFAFTGTTETGSAVRELLLPILQRRMCCCGYCNRRQACCRLT